LSVRDTWCTPDEVFNYYRRLYQYTLDVCASASNTKLSDYFTEENSALEGDWSQHSRAWCNPPYSNILPFVERAVHFKDTTETSFLVPLDSSTKWFKLALAHAKDVRLIVGGRIQFIPPDGVVASSNNKASCLIHIGQGERTFHTDFIEDIMNER